MGRSVEDFNIRMCVLGLELCLLFCVSDNYYYESEDLRVCCAFVYALDV